VLIKSSTLPDLDGALESSKGLANGPPLQLVKEPEDQLDRRDEVRDSGDASGVSSSLYRRGRGLLGGGSSRSVEPAPLLSSVHSDRCEGDDPTRLRGGYC
jgi:hypothetical protein